MSPGRKKDRCTLNVIDRRFVQSPSKWLHLPSYFWKVLLFPNVFFYGLQMDMRNLSNRFGKCFIWHVWLYFNGFLSSSSCDAESSKGWDQICFRPCWTTKRSFTWKVNNERGFSIRGLSVVSVHRLSMRCYPHHLQAPGPQQWEHVWIEDGPYGRCKNSKQLLSGLWSQRTRDSLRGSMWLRMSDCALPLVHILVIWIITLSAPARFEKSILHYMTSY